MDKIDKLQELNDLLKSGAISRDEFISLKNDIFKSSDPLPKTAKEKVDNSTKEDNKEKIILKSFNDNKGDYHRAPQIEYINKKNLSDSDVILLKPFLRLKQIYSPAEMTRDEIEIANRLFSVQEIAEMNGERPGFNHAYASILSVLASASALFFIYITPCLIIFGAGTGLIASIFVSLSTLNKVDATKLDKIFCYIALTISAIAIILYFKGSDGHSLPFSSYSSATAVVGVDCANRNGDYKSGYSSGKLVALMGESSSCESYVAKTNTATGRDIMSASECFCSGFNDGKNGEPEKYKTTIPEKVEVETMPLHNPTEETVVANIDSQDTSFNNDVVTKPKLPSRDNEKNSEETPKTNETVNPKDDNNDILIKVLKYEDFYEGMYHMSKYNRNYIYQIIGDGSGNRENWKYITVYKIVGRNNDSETDFGQYPLEKYIRKDNDTFKFKYFGNNIETIYTKKLNTKPDY